MTIIERRRRGGEEDSQAAESEARRVARRGLKEGSFHAPLNSLPFSLCSPRPPFILVDICGGHVETGGRGRKADFSRILSTSNYPQSFFSSVTMTTEEK